MTTNNKDKPKVHFSYSQFEDVDIEEFVYVTKSNKRIVFPDIFGMEAQESERILRSVMSNDVLPLEGIRNWLPKDDYEALLKDRLRERDVARLAEAAQAHYEKYWGDSGEGSASAS